MDTRERSDRLLAAYLYCKQRLLEAAGVRGSAFANARSILGKHMDRIAELTGSWDFTPDTIMEAAFAWARKCKHPNGPMLNAVNAKYLTNALSWYLELPYEAVADRKSMRAFYDKMDAELERWNLELSGCEGIGLVTRTFIPVEFRYAVAVARKDTEAIRLLARSLIEICDTDPKVAAWLGHKGPGYSYRDAAEAHNHSSDYHGTHP